MDNDILKERTSSYIVKGKRECIFRKIDDEYILIIYEDNTDEYQRPEYFILNASGALIWHFLQEVQAPSELLKKIILYYSKVEASVLKSDLNKFLNMLLELQLIDFSSEKKEAPCGIDYEAKEISVGNSKDKKYISPTIEASKLELTVSAQCEDPVDPSPFTCFCLDVEPPQTS